MLWRPVKDVPKCRHVFILFEEYGVKHITIAMYVPKHTLKDYAYDPFDDSYDDDEETGERYWPEGWYERRLFAGDDGITDYACGDIKVLGWLHLNLLGKIKQWDWDNKV